MTISLMIFITALVFTGLFAGSETGFITLKLPKILEWKNEKKRKNLIKFIDNQEIMLGTTLVGTNIFSIIASTYATKLSLSFSEGNSLETFIYTFLFGLAILIFAEILPKVIFRENAEELISSASYFIYFFHLLFYPIIKILTFISKYSINLMGIKENKVRFLASKKDINYYISEGKKVGIVDDEEIKMINEVIAFSEKNVSDIMIPRHEIVAAKDSYTVRQVIEIAKKSGHSYIPIYKKDLDDTHSKINIHHLIAYPNPDETIVNCSKVSKINYVPETKNLRDLLGNLKSKGQSPAIVVDEYGSASGLVTIEDVLEELVGEIEDEYDVLKSKKITKVNMNEYQVCADIDLEELEEELGISMPEGQYKSLGGYIVSKAERMPARNEVFLEESIPGKLIEIKIIEADQKRIDKVKVIIKNEL